LGGSVHADTNRNVFDQPAGTTQTHFGRKPAINHPTNQTFGVLHITLGYTKFVQISSNFGRMIHDYSARRSDNYLYGDGSKPCTPGEPQNSWDLWMFIPLKMVLIGIDP